MRLQDLNQGGLNDILSRIRALETQTLLYAYSLTDGRFRIGGTATLLVDSSGGIVIHGSLNGDGAITWTGVTTLNGTTNLNGPVNIAGLATLASTLTVNSPGKIVVAGAIPMTLGPTVYGAGVAFSNGAALSTTSNPGGALLTSGGAGQVQVSTGIAQLAVGVKSVVVSASQTTVSGLLAADSLSVVGPKSFRMPHPSKPGMMIQHGSTESPVSGTEYTGEGVLGQNGECVVDLPDYFEALNKLRNRTVQITPIGQAFPVGTSRIENGQFTVYGEPNGEFFWTAKGERFGGDFEVESEDESGSLDNTTVSE